jgi:hypothetical protein
MIVIPVGLSKHKTLLVSGMFSPLHLPVIKIIVIGIEMNVSHRPEAFIPSQK